MYTPSTSFLEHLLGTLLRSGSIKARALQRLSIIHSYYFENRTRSQTARHTSCAETTVDRWIKRWEEYEDEISEWFKMVEDEVRSPTADREFVLSIVEDSPRPGAPATFGDEVRDQVIALALTKPEEHGIPVDKWTHELLAKQVVASGIAPKMSSTRVGDFLKSARHKSSSQ